MEEDPELTYWNLASKPQPVPLLPPPVPALYTPRHPPFQPYNPLPPVAAGLCYPVTDVLTTCAQHQLQSSSERQQMTTDSLIHEEVTRAAKTLFSKRNRTLMHWLNPAISMNQLKAEVNAAWDCLPPSQKVFYISQVLGKFAPHTTSLMVNPQLDPSLSVSAAVRTEEAGGGRKGGVAKRRGLSGRVRRARTKRSREKDSSDDDASCDSSLVVDLPPVKRKYTRRKRRVQGGDGGEGECSSTNACPLPVPVQDIKVEPGTETTTTTAEAPRVKRKYVKRKLVRKKYKKRQPKNNINETQEEVVTSSVPESESQSAVWLGLDDNLLLSNEIDNFNLSTEEVDSFWSTIDNPNDLFIELEIE